MIFENTSPKGSFWQNKINYDILQLSADSRYLWSYVLNHYSAKAHVISPNTWAISRKLERYNGFIIQHIDNKTQFEEKVSTSLFLKKAFKDGLSISMDINSHGFGRGTSIHQRKPNVLPKRFNERSQPNEKR